MKKLFFHAALVLPLMLLAVSCSESNDGGNEAVKLESGTDTKQQVFADDTAPAPIRFTATAAWTATVADTTPVRTKTEAGRLDWLKLDKYEGGAGEVSLTMTLTPNLTGQDRKAEIRITCAGTTITITVEQKGTKADGELPDGAEPNPDKPEPENPDPDQNPKNRIVRIEKYWFDQTGGLEPLDEYYEFAYDETGRVIGIKWFEYGSDGYDDTEENTTLTYGDKTIAYKTVQREGTETTTSTGSIVLDEHGRTISGEMKINSALYNYTLSYDETGQLVETASKESIGNKTEYVYKFQLKWTNGNPTQVEQFENGTKIQTGTAEYGTIANNANIDLNWLLVLSDSGGAWEYATGDTMLIGSALGYCGIRSKQMAIRTTTTYIEGEHFVEESDTYEYELDAAGRIKKITAIGDFEYRITYAE